MKKIQKKARQDTRSKDGDSGDDKKQKLKDEDSKFLQSVPILNYCTFPYSYLYSVQQLSAVTTVQKPSKVDKGLVSCQLQGWIQTDFLGREGGGEV